MACDITDLNFTAVAVPIGPNIIPLPFSQRTTCAVAVFAALLIAAPAGAQRFAVGNGVTLGALQTEYGQLYRVYRILRRQDVANQRMILVSAVIQAMNAVTALLATINTLSATGNDASVLAYMQIVVANSLVQIQKVQFDEA